MLACNSLCVGKLLAGETSQVRHRGVDVGDGELGRRDREVQAPDVGEDVREVRGDVIPPLAVAPRAVTTAPGLDQHGRTSRRSGRLTSSARGSVMIMSIQCLTCCGTPKLYMGTAKM